MKELHVLFDGPPSHEAGRFVEAEDENGKGVGIGEWKEIDGYWHLIIPYNEAAERKIVELEARIEQMESLLQATRECYEKWKDMPDHGTLSEALFHGDCWHVIKQIGEAGEK